MNPILALQLVTAIFVLFLGFFVLNKNWRSPAHRYFWMFAMSIAGWNISLFVAISEIGQSTPWARLVFFFGGLIPVGLFLFSKTFMSKAARLGAFDRTLAALGVVIATASGTKLIAKSARSAGHLYLIGDFSKLMPVHFIYFFGVLIGAFIVLISKHRRAANQEKMHLKYVILGFLSFFIPFLITDIVLPNAFGIFEYNNLGPIFTLPMVFLIAYAIVRHQLLDIRVIIQRGIVYSLVFFAVIALYLSTIFVTEDFFKETATLADIASAGLTTVIGIATVPFIEKYFRRVTDKIFFKDKYDYSKAMYALSEILNRNIDLEILVRETCGGLKTIFKTESADIVIFLDELPPASATENQITVPVVLENRELGAIILGPKLSGDPYTQEDFTLLKTFSYQAAVAIEKAELYKKVKDHSRELEERVRERTAQIRMLEEGRQQMMIDISHGLQTPLTVVKGELEVLKSQVPDHEKIDLLGNSIDKVSKSIYDLLNLARLESGQDDFKKDPVDISGLLHDILEYVDVIAKEKHITVRTKIEPGVSIRGQKDRLEELIVGLVSNAVKYTEGAPHKEIVVTLAKMDASAEISIEDTGSGISAEDLPHIFERFYRVKDHGPKNAKGTGLGLAIAKKIVEKHNGTIDVKSKLGVGTKFAISFPLRKRFAETP